jgi:hypothetical protein
MTVNEGEAFVEGTDADTAKGLLEAAEKAGLDPAVVRLAPGDGGFIVPEELAPKPKKSTSDKPAAKSTTDKK